MKYRFQILDRLINGDLSPENYIINEPYENDTNCLNVQYFNLIKELFTGIKKELIFEISKSEKKSERKNATNEFLTEILNFYNLNNTKIQIYNEQKNTKIIYTSIRENIEQILNRIIFTYKEYLNPEIKLPISFISKLLEQYNEKNIELFENLTKNKVDIKLIELLKQEHENLISSEQEIEKIYYLKEIHTTMCELIKSKEIINIQDIERLLFKKNYNSENYIKYLTEKLEEEINQAEGKIEKLTIIYNAKKYYLNIKIDKFISYDKNEQSISAIIEKMLNQEKEHLLIQLEYNKESENKKKSEKLNTRLSVEQLCVLFRILHETEILYHNNQSETFRFINQNIKTHQVEEISIDSIKSKYYSNDQATLNTVKNKIFELMAIIRKKMK